jgi:hypothetical protein
MPRSHGLVEVVGSLLIGDIVGEAIYVGVQRNTTNTPAIGQA